MPDFTVTGGVLILKEEQVVVEDSTANSGKLRKVAKCLSWTMLKKPSAVETYLDIFLSF